MCWGKPDSVWMMSILLVVLSVLWGWASVTEVFSEIHRGAWPIASVVCALTGLLGCLPPSILLLRGSPLSIYWLWMGAVWQLAMAFVITEQYSFGVDQEWGRFVLIGASALCQACMAYLAEDLRRDGFLGKQERSLVPPTIARPMS